MKLSLCISAMTSLAWLHAAFAVGQQVATRPSDLAQSIADPDIRTPAAALTPRINGPRVYGERSGHPFLYRLPVSGERPISITAAALPTGVLLDAGTGNLSGRVAQPGTYDVAVTATNSRGKDTAILRIVIGDTIALTPPMGWNSWNCFTMGVTGAKVRAAADTLVSTGLIDHGWTYINVDDGWSGSRDAGGHIIPNHKFSDMKALGDYIHGKGLKFGIYTTPGPITCGGCVGTFGHEADDISSFAGWGVDYLKYDGCTIDAAGALVREQLFARELPDHAAELIQLGSEARDLMLKASNHMPGKGPGDVPRLAEINARLAVLHAAVPAAMRAGIEQQLERGPWQKMGAIVTRADRDMVYSISQSGAYNSWEWAAAFGASSWRITHDIAARWKSVETHAFLPVDEALERFNGPGHWNDPDMLEIGNGKLTPDENYLHMTAWCMLSAPLLIGCDMTRMTPLTISILSNDEVLAVDQDSLGIEASRIKQTGNCEAWRKPLSDGSLAVALFNRGETPAVVALTWPELKIAGKHQIRDLWRQTNLDVSETGLSKTIAPHSAEMFKIPA